MPTRRLSELRPLRGVAGALQRLNQRHPWSHNDAFHPWILTRLPARRDLAIDVGCGQGELAALLVEPFARVHATDLDAGMRAAAQRRCAGLDNVVVDDTSLAAMADTSADLITMIAVLHHLELEPALEHIARVLRPGGRFLCVGLARPASLTDHAWDLASSVTNPVIGLVRHPWPADDDLLTPAFPVADPRQTFGEIRTAARAVLPGAALTRRLAFRYTLEWTKP